MYAYRKMSSSEREEIVAHRKQLGLPLHEPPHYPDGPHTYLITGATYEHHHILKTQQRREQFMDMFWTRVSSLQDAEVFAWVVLPDHYHVLIRAELEALAGMLKPLHNRSATTWNREDAAKGRKVWFRFSDRRIRSDAHFNSAINYIHANPVKHGYAAKADDWNPTSFHIWLEQYGRERLVALWKGFPVLDMGHGWDD